MSGWDDPRTASALVDSGTSRLQSEWLRDHGYEVPDSDEERHRLLRSITEKAAEVAP